MITHGNKQISEIVYARKASEGGGAVRLTNIIRGAQVVFGDLIPRLGWQLLGATKAAILAAFGQTDGKAVIKATNAYLNALAATDPTKASALAGFINEDPMLVCSLGLQPQGVTMPIRFATTDGATPIDTGIKPSKTLSVHLRMKFPTPSTSSIHRNLFGIYNYNGGWRRDTYFLKFNTLSSSSHKILCGLSVSTNTSQIDQEINIPLNTDFNVEITPTKYIVNGVNSKSYTIPTEFEQTYTLVMFGTRLYTNGSVSGAGCVFAIKECIMEDNGVAIGNFYPSIQHGVQGYVNLVTCTFHQNLGSGSFTIAYTLPDGTPWTPLNQTP